MSKARETYFCLRIVEYTSIPLTVCIIFYIVSGYGMVSPILNIVGLTYSVSAKMHTLPLLRFVTAVLAILHFYGGVMIISSRHVKREKIRELIKLITLVTALILSSLIVLSEFKIIFG
ncbi:MAG: hypothetical protein QXL11_00205 [Zestosphaera sp.]